MNIMFLEFIHVCVFGMLDHPNNIECINVRLMYLNKGRYMVLLKIGFLGYFKNPFIHM